MLQPCVLTIHLDIPEWIAAILKSLRHHGRVGVLLALAQKALLSITQLMRAPLLRDHVFPIFRILLLGYQHSADVFLSLTSELTQLLRLFRQELLSVDVEQSAAIPTPGPSVDTTSSNEDVSSSTPAQVTSAPATAAASSPNTDVAATTPVQSGSAQPPSASLLKELLHTLHCLMLIHTGHPDAYDTLLAAMSDLSGVSAMPTEADMKETLLAFAWGGTYTTSGVSKAYLHHPSEYDQL